MCTLRCGRPHNMVSPLVRLRYATSVGKLARAACSAGCCCRMMHRASAGARAASSGTAVWQPVQASGEAAHTGQCQPGSLPADCVCRPAPGPVESVGGGLGPTYITLSVLGCAPWGQFALKSAGTAVLTRRHLCAT